MVRWLASLLICFLFVSTAPAAEPAVRIVALGDSITRGVRPGVQASEMFSAIVQAKLRQQGIEGEVVNAGIGGERTDQALVRLEKDVISLKPRIVTIMYGTNDSYVDRGQQASRISVEAYRGNLRSLVAKL